MFKKILIANRGEIACRIIRTAKKLGIHCIAIYSEIDRNALHVKLADKAYLVGPAPSQESYLNIDAIIAVAKKSGAEAIHPGYGFLSENAGFAARCEQEKIKFIGPDSKAIAAMGSKITAKKIMQAANIPVTPGYFGKTQTLAAFKKAAQRMGYPVLLKAAAGGGGKGMRLVNNARELPNALISAKREAEASFDDSQMLLEKYFPDSRHIEVQVFADENGNYVYLFDRDCSIQRRHQKIIERAPAANLSDALHQQLGNTAVAAAKAIHYVNAGTVEFLLDANNDFYFMEMNTRLQVEHPITEMITGQDLVEWQLRIASGEALPLSQNQISMTGHAIEARIYSEDPSNDFLPSIGKIIYLHAPKETEKLRIDTGIETGDQISIFYDPLIAKMISWGKTNDAAIESLYQGLCDYHLVGVETNVELLKKIMQHPQFINGKANTQFIEKFKKDLILIPPPITPKILALGTLYLLLAQQQAAKSAAHSSEDHFSPWFQSDNWRLNTTTTQTFNFLVSGNKTSVTALPMANSYLFELLHSQMEVSGNLQQQQLSAVINEEAVTAAVVPYHNALHLFVDETHTVLPIFNEMTQAELTATASGQLLAPMPGTLVEIFVKPNQKVSKGQNLMVIEAMKMEHTITAPQDGRIKKINFKKGELVPEGAELLALMPV